MQPKVKLLLTVRTIQGRTRFPTGLSEARSFPPTGKFWPRTDVYDDGTEDRVYPYANVFSHVIGYDTHGKSGLESEANFQLLSSHEFFLTQMKNEFLGRKNMGDTVISTLRADLQTTAYYALGDRRGAVVVMEPDTGKILAMVSKPDFDPNTLGRTGTGW